MKLRITRTAATQFRSAIAYIKADSPQRAATLTQAIDRSLDTICDHPDIGRLIDLVTRRLRYQIPQTYYALVYRSDHVHDEVVLLRVFDARRDIRVD